MVKTRRSGENGEVEDVNCSMNDVGEPPDEKMKSPETILTPRELRSTQSQYKVTRNIQSWPPKYSRRRRSIKMPRIVFPESDTEGEKYSRHSRGMRVFFADNNNSANRSVRIRRGPRKNYGEESEDKPIQENVRRSCRKRKLLHHNFNESWITNELKVKGYPDLYGFLGNSSTDEYSSGDEARGRQKQIVPQNHVDTPVATLSIIDEETQHARQRRTSARFNNNKKLNGGTDSESEEENNRTVVEKKPESKEVKKEDQKAEVESKDKNGKEEVTAQESESNQAPVRSLRRKVRKTPKKDEIRNEAVFDLSSSESGSELTLRRAPRRSKRTRKPQPAFVQIAQAETRARAKTFTIRKKPYSLRERKPKILRRKTMGSESPSTSSDSSSSSDTEEDLNVSMKNKTKGRQKSKSMDDKKDDRALRDIQPVELDGRVRFSSVGGLEEHIKCLREMVLFPLMYPDLFKKFNTRPAKGVLFHGGPGTGKTLLARALANECSLIGGRKVAFFMRKGADCLKKWVGESERHLKLLFQQANKMKPSIIFFDEIDALAPVRSVRQEQVHTSVVGTLLAEMDGLCDRGEVVIIGATNRLDAVDPALRRAGRFDRELHFPPPHSSARADILRIYTKDWNPPITDDVIEHVADITAGYGGSDLKALCSEAVLKALRRVYPQVYESEHALVIDSKNVEVTKEDILEAMRTLVAAGSRTAPPSARRLPHYCEPLLQTQLKTAANLLDTIFPSDPMQRLGEFLSPNVLLVSGPCAETYIAPALLARLEHCTVKELSIATLHSALTFTQEQAVISVFSECRRADRGCVLFIRDVSSVWALLRASHGAALLLQLWRARAAGPGTLLLATTAEPHAELPSELQELFPIHKECVYSVREPNASEVIAFLKPIIAEALQDPPPLESNEPPPPLPRAPPPPPPRETPDEINRRKRKEDYKLRELRIFLRDICRKLASNRRFYKFTKPVDLKEVTDYLDIVEQPMDLETMMTKVDMHKYNCAKEFLDDIDLICANALEYNPDRTSSDKQIRHEACSLRDHAYALIDVEMDSDFESQCQEIAKKRQEEGNAMDTDLPDFIYTASTLRISDSLLNDTGVKSPRVHQNGEKGDVHCAKRKRRRMNAWSKGLVAKRPRTSGKNLNITDEESKENKPITSTPLPNGSVSSTSGSDDDAPLRRPPDDADAVLSGTMENKHKDDSPPRPAEKSTSKASPKKRSSGHENSSAESEKVLINKTELENIVYKNAKALRAIGLRTLFDLHSQLLKVVHTYSTKHDRTKLPQELNAIVTRYLQCAKK